MQQKHKHLALNRYTASILVFLIIAAVSFVAVTKYNRTDAVTPAKPAVGAAVKSKFSSTGTAGWWQGASNETSMALFQNSHACFTSVEYKTGTMDAAAALQKAQTMLTNDGYTVTPGSVQTMTLQTTSGPQQYELHQSSVTSPSGSNKIEGGQEFGYVQLPGGYVKVEGYCDSADELPATIPALQTVTFDKDN